MPALTPQAAAYQREAARLAGRAGDSRPLATALVNLSDHLGGTEPAAAEAARAAAGHARRVGARRNLAIAIGNLADALLLLGDWDAAEAELAQAADSGVLAGYEFLASQRAWRADKLGVSRRSHLGRCWGQCTGPRLVAAPRRGWRLLPRRQAMTLTFSA